MTAEWMLLAIPLAALLLLLGVVADAFRPNPPRVTKESTDGQ